MAAVHENDDILMLSTHYEPSGGIPTGGDHWPVWLRGLGDGTFVDASVAIPDDPEYDAFALVPCDVDNDGDLDLIEGGRRRIPLQPQERRPRLLLQTPTAFGPTFAVADAVAWNLPVVHRIHELTCADLDGDGHVDDLLLAHQKVEKTHLLLSTGATFLDRSDLLPNHPGAPGFDFMTEVEWTQSIAACRLEAVAGLSPNAVTLIFANGNINESYTKHQPNLVMSALPGQAFQATHLLTGLRLERSFDMTDEVVCADLDGNGLADAVFVANNQGRDYLWRYRMSGTGP